MHEKNSNIGMRPYRVLPKRGLKSELVKGQALSPGIDDPRPRRLCEPQSRHLHCRHLVNPLVISHRPHNHGDLTLLILGKTEQKS